MLIYFILFIALRKQCCTVLLHNRANPLDYRVNYHSDLPTKGTGKKIIACIKHRLISALQVDLVIFENILVIFENRSTPYAAFSLIAFSISE